MRYCRSLSWTSTIQSHPSPLEQLELCFWQQAAIHYCTLCS
jgi:hypothetical protein